MVRLLAYALYADEQLAFTRGISTDDEPDLWAKDLTGEIQLWIELGQPDETRIRKACNRSRQVVVITFGARASEPWWDKIQQGMTRFDNLTVLRIPTEASATLAEWCDRSMQAQVTIQDGAAFISIANSSMTVSPIIWKSAEGAQP